MSLVTTCPSCGTMFKVQSTALSTYGGEGRCSVCQHVFNALEHATDLNGHANNDTDAPESEVVISPSVASPMAPVGEPLDADLSEVVPLSAEFDSFPPKHIETIAQDIPETLFQKKRFAWGAFLKSFLVVFFLLIAALLQTSLFFRGQIVERVPATYPMLDSLCNIFSCHVPLPHQAGLITIEDYRLRDHPDYDDVLVLESTLYNHASFPLAFPELNLTLIGNSSVSRANRIFRPEDYLPKEISVSQGMKGNSSISVVLYLGIGGIQSRKYTLSIQDAPISSMTDSDASS